MNKAAAVAFGTLALSAVAWFVAPAGWQWPAVGTVAFFGIFFAVRFAAAAIGEEAERRFDGKK